jgi:hypothetical protein
MRKFGRRKLSTDPVISASVFGDAWHHDLLAYLGGINTSLALLAILRIYGIARRSKLIPGGPSKGNVSVDFMSLVVLGLAHFSQAFYNFKNGLTSNRWIMGKGLDIITILDALFATLDWIAAAGLVAKR